MTAKEFTRRQTMNQYKASTPRTAMGMAACALTIGTFALLVVGPATYLADHDDGFMTAREGTAADVIRVLPTVEVIARRAGSGDSATLEVAPALRKLPG
jgi:hypothetical protein